MNTEQLNLNVISLEDMLLINGGAAEGAIDTSSTAYQIGYTVGQAVRNAVAAYGVYAFFFL